MDERRQGYAPSSCLTIDPVGVHAPQDGVIEFLDRQGERVADAALGPDDTRWARIGLQLAPQPQDLDVHGSVEDIFVHVRCLQQGLAAERPLRCAQEGEQQRIFAFRQGDPVSVGAGQTAGAAMKQPTTVPAAARLGIWLWGALSGGPAPKYRPNTGQQLPK